MPLLAQNRCSRRWGGKADSVFAVGKFPVALLVMFRVPETDNLHRQGKG